MPHTTTPNDRALRPEVLRGMLDGLEALGLFLRSVGTMVGVGPAFEVRYAYRPAPWSTSGALVYVGHERDCPCRHCPKWAR